MNRRPGEDLKRRVERLITIGQQTKEDILNHDSFRELFEQVSEMLGKETRPRILMAGKTGCGKSSVLNALLGRNVFEVGNIPTTRSNLEEIWETEHGDIVVVDVPGFAEADAAQVNNLTYEENMTHIAELEAHMAILVIKCDDRALEKENAFLENWKKHPILKDLPVLVVVNQIDKMKPVRDWSPQTLNLKVPVREKEKNIREFIDYLGTVSGFAEYAVKGLLIPFSAGEQFDDPLQYGLQDLRMRIYQMLPECARTMFARVANLMEVEGNRIIGYYAGGSAAAVAINPIAGSDAILIVPLQIAMILNLGRLYGIPVTANVARGLVNSLITTLTGRFAYQAFISMFPVIKNIVGPGLAYSLTYVMGRIVNEMFKNKKLEATTEEIRKMAGQVSEEEIKRACSDLKN